MSESCTSNPELARKSLTAILQRLASVGQKPLGEALARSETWISRWKSDDSESCADLLAALGLKVVPAEHECYSPEFIRSLRYFARIGMESADGSEQPKQEDAE